jgi:hypothetical protein
VEKSFDGFESGFMKGEWILFDELDDKNIGIEVDAVKNAEF